MYRTINMLGDFSFKETAKNENETAGSSDGTPRSGDCCGKINQGVYVTWIVIPSYFVPRHQHSRSSPTYPACKAAHKKIVASFFKRPKAQCCLLAEL